MNEYTETYPDLMPSDFDHVERALGIAIPAELKEHYSQVNGGRPRCKSFIHDDEYFDIQQFLPMKYGDRNSNLESAYRDLVVETEEFPKQVIPFAIDDGGDYFLYSIASSSFGKILFYQSDYYDDPERSIVILASTFRDFLAGLKCAE